MLEQNEVNKLVECLLDIGDVQVYSYEEYIILVMMRGGNIKAYCCSSSEEELTCPIRLKVAEEFMQNIFYKLPTLKVATT